MRGCGLDASGSPWQLMVSFEYGNKALHVTKCMEFTNSEITSFSRILLIGNIYLIYFAHYISFVGFFVASCFTAEQLLLRSEIGEVARVSLLPKNFASMGPCMHTVTYCSHQVFWKSWTACSYKGGRNIY
jgi:hypothetical protein